MFGGVLLCMTLGASGCREHVEEEDLEPGQHRGEVLFEHHCAACHGMDGRGRGLPSPPGDTVVSRNLAARAFQADSSDAQISKVVREGEPPWMPAFEHVLSPAEIRDVVEHVRTLTPPPEHNP